MDEEAAPRYGLVLIGIVAVIIMTALSDLGRGLAFAALVVQGVVLVFVLRTSGTGRRLRHWATGAVVVAVLVGVGALILGGEGVDRATPVMSTLLAVATPIAILRGVAARPTVDTAVVTGAVCIYLLLGLFFAQVYVIEDAFSDGAFFAQVEDPSQVDYTYFSYVTLATVGYGDLTARGDIGRITSVTEALFGQLYLVTVVALVISRIGHERAGRGRAP